MAGGRAATEADALPVAEVRDAIPEIAEAILGLPSKRPVRVGICGRSAAGKTTFGDKLASSLTRSGRPVLRAQFDDFHPPGHALRSAAGGYTVESYYDEAYDYAGFRDLLLIPLGPGGSRCCRLALHDSYTDTPKGVEVDVPSDAIVVIDGIFILRPDLRDYWEFTIWLDVSFETMIERAAKRDVAWMPSEAAVRERYLARWIPLHALYEETGARACADVIIDNQDLHAPRPVALRSPPHS